MISMPRDLDLGQETLKSKHLKGMEGAALLPANLWDNFQVSDFAMPTKSGEI